MEKHLTFNGRKITMHAEDFDYIFKKLQEIETAEIKEVDEWESTDASETCMFDRFMTAARTYASASPPDFEQMCRKLWGGASLSIREYTLRHFGVLLRTDRSKKAMVNIVCCGLSGRMACALVEKWNIAKECQRCSIELTIRFEAEYDSLIDEISGICEILESADVEEVRKKLFSSTKLEITPCAKGKAEVGLMEYEYDQQATDRRSELN